MFRKCTVYCLTLMMAVNSLLMASGGAMLCLHDHNYSHLVIDEHSEHGEDCHGHEAIPEHRHYHEDDSHAMKSVDAPPHCMDIVMKSSDELTPWRSEVFSNKKPAAVSLNYEPYRPASVASAFPEIRLAYRAPPDNCGVLEQCVRMTVLRL